METYDGKRVLFLANSGQIAGGNRVLLQLCVSLADRGITPIVASPAAGPLSTACAERKITCEVLDFDQPDRRRPLYTIRTWLKWYKWLRKSRIDVIHANEIRPARCVCWPAYWASIPLVCHVHFPPSATMVEWAFNFMPKPQTFLFCSRALAKEVEPVISRISPRSQYKVVGNALDLRDFSIPTPSTNTVPRVGIVAQLTPVKGHVDFIEAARELTARNIVADYWIIGDDIQGLGYRQKLEQCARDLGVEDRIAFLGHRSDIASILGQLDIVVCSSHVEPFGMCLLEAMACQRPVVATSVGGIPDIVEDGVSGLLVPPRSPKQLADGIQKLIEEPAIRARMGRSGRRRVEEAFTQDRYTENMLGVYRSVTRRNGKATSIVRRREHSPDEARRCKLVQALGVGAEISAGCTEPSVARKSLS